MYRKNKKWKVRVIRVIYYNIFYPKGEDLGRTTVGSAYD